MDNGMDGSQGTVQRYRREDVEQFKQADLRKICGMVNLMIKQKLVPELRDAILALYSALGPTGCQRNDPHEEKWLTFVVHHGEGPSSKKGTQTILAQGIPRRYLPAPTLIHRLESL